MDIYAMIKIGGIILLVFNALLLFIALFRLARVIERVISSRCRRITSIAMFALLILGCFLYTNPLIRIRLV